MTDKEAKKELEYRRLEFEVKKELKETQFEKRGIQKGIAAFRSAIAALEKQIPKKPVYENKFDDCVVYSCPACKDKKLILDGDNYCTVCGQALDWSDKE